MSIVRQQGLTLIEVITVVAIVGILAAIAVPSYQGYVTKAARTTGKTALVVAGAKFQNYVVNNKVAPTDMTSLGYAAATASINKSGDETAGTDAVYQLSFSQPTGCSGTNCYLITATAVNAQAANDTDCLNLTLTMLGVKGATGPQGVACWN